MKRRAKPKSPLGSAGGARSSGDLIRQASLMQGKIDSVRQQLIGRELTATGAGGRVGVTVTCEGRVRSITVEPELLASEGLELVLDAVTATLNSALDQAEALAQSEIDKVTGGLKIPGVTA